MKILFPKYCPHNKGRVYYVILQILLAYQELCILFQNSIPAKFMLGKVKQQYILYKVAEKLGMEEAKQHRDFVLKHGGTTFYKKELEALTSEELHNETDVK